MLVAVKFFDTDCGPDRAAADAAADREAACLRRAAECRCDNVVALVGTTTLQDA